MASAASKGSILIVEDDGHTANLVKTYLEREGFATLAAADGRSALDIAGRQPLCCIILDIMLPKLDGWEVCRRIRRTSNVPIVMLSAREEEIDRVMGLSIGADDYVVKPFSPRELVERVKAILRRTHPPPPLEEEWRHGALVLNDAKHKVTLAGVPVELTGSEYKLLRTLMRSPGRVFSREELLAEFYAYGEAVIDRVIDVHIGKLRQKIEPNPARPTYILTVRGFGYRLAEAAEEPRP
ncbi:MAG: response regulator transcription factor [Desulfobulbus sp.]|jgi:DNA-binding response OmpR family regulator|uniref:response regulator transcription factor n=1 Tax=Desulfobulbus sp. TaxID=895 RepID=UPI0028406614|nr:response regulator transcription factor [Desulfobulbus sp.]MDR2549595.1 response regulator transcription factor [Desulfobulbus sp.]